MKILTLFLIPIFFIGCSTIPHGTAPSSSPLINKSGDNIKYRVLGTSIADAGHFSLFGIIPFGRADIDEAINEAIQKKGGDNLINLCYDIEYVSYFIFGTGTSIKLKGDVIKYDGVGETSTTNRIDIIDYKSPSKSTVSHSLGVNFISSGLGFNYNLIMPFNDIVFGKVAVGYRAFNEEYESSYSFGSDVYTYKGTTNHQFIPLTFSAGVFTEKFIKTDIPFNGIAAFGLGYYPDVDRDEWVNFGWNLGLGAEYRVIKNLALGLFFNYHKLFVGEDNLSNFYGNYSKSGKQSFSEFGLMIRLVP